MRFIYLTASIFGTLASLTALAMALTFAAHNHTQFDTVDYFIITAIYLWAATAITSTIVTVINLYLKDS